MVQPHVSIFKYPLGFIRVVEFVFIVLAIAAVNSWSFNMTFDCPAVATRTNRTVKANTFTLSKVNVPTCADSSLEAPLWEDGNNAGGSAGFFYFVNVAALIFVLAVTFMYVIFWELYQENKRFALADLALTALFFILFFFCSSIWWAGSNTIGFSTGNEEIKRLLNDKPAFWNHTASTDTLNLNRDTNNGKLAISVLCDWVNVLCFAVNCWFIWKEIVPRDQEQPGVIG